jgi:hypothetical protein
MITQASLGVDCNCPELLAGANFQPLVDMRSSNGWKHLRKGEVDRRWACPTAIPRNHRSRRSPARMERLRRLFIEFRFAAGELPAAGTPVAAGAFLTRRGRPFYN